MFNQTQISIRNVTIISLSLLFYSFLLVVVISVFSVNNSGISSVLGLSTNNASSSSVDIASGGVEGYLKEVFSINSEEKPTVANLKNVENLKVENPVFYRNAEEGDVVYIFNDLAVLIRPEGNKIVSVVYF